MNRIPFLEKSDFPLDANVLNELQKISTEELQNAIIGIAGGRNCILSGVVLNSGSYSNGIVIINGEILPFVASSGGWVIIIEENDTTSTGETYNVLKRRYAMATTQNTNFSMSCLEAVASERLFSPGPLVDTLGIGTNSVVNTSGLYCGKTDSGFVVLSGVIRYLGQTIQAGWYHIISLSILPELIPVEQGFDIYFTAYCEVPQNMALSGIVPLKGRIKKDGDFQLFFGDCDIPESPPGGLVIHVHLVYHL